ncbi:hypothetical protein H2198_003735 [Neophaeococcomyces mojaviensis]|uniref:Uncharacterized protein n=1 Tax=Neophaeococcomyces mojaviensis TaxID=3383035 RepID=A0ACC3AAQ8_9EURO|nr:hypothetical protein H2198_003735 [Knufia sp. JES_112]
MVYEARFLSKTYHQPLVVLAQSQKALKALRKEVANLQHGPVSVFLASVVLAAAEVLQRQFVNALIHLRGGYKVLTSSWHRSFDHGQPAKAALCSTDSRFAVKDSIKDALYSLAQSLDLQTAWYKLFEPPELQLIFDLAKPFPAAHDVADIRMTILSCLHGCYHFAHRAAKFKYIPLAHTPPSLTLEQSRYIAALSKCLARIGSAPSQTTIEPTSRMFLVLRVQCLSTLIYLSTILSPYEISYDSYTAHFQEILTISEEIATRFQNPIPTRSPPVFQLEPGISQALFLTAMKCRDPYHRRRAVAMLTGIGIEGPWNARVTAWVAKRAIAVEEVGQHFQGLESGCPTTPPETRRLHGCGLDYSAPDNASSTHLQVNFSLCRDVQRMLQASSHEDPEHWTIWTERVEIQD